MFVSVKCCHVATMIIMDQLIYFKTTLDYKNTRFGPKMPLCVLNNLYFKTTCNIRPNFLGPIGGLKIAGPLYIIIYYKCYYNYPSSVLAAVVVVTWNTPCPQCSTWLELP